MDIKATYTAMIAELKNKSKETGDKIKSATVTLQAEKDVYDGQIKQLQAGLKLLENPVQVKKTRTVKPK